MSNLLSNTLAERLEGAGWAVVPALVNVVTDWRARATTAAFTKYVT